MKTLLLALLLLASCASTTLYHDGVPVARFEGDMTKMRFTAHADGSVSWTADKVSHSAATIAAGKTSAGNIAATGVAATSVLLIP